MVEPVGTMLVPMFVILLGLLEPFTQAQTPLNLNYG